MKINIGGFDFLTEKDVDPLEGKEVYFFQRDSRNGEIVKLRGTIISTDKDYVYNKFDPVIYVEIDEFNDEELSEFIADYGKERIYNLFALTPFLEE